MWELCYGDKRLSICNTYARVFRRNVIFLTPRSDNSDIILYTINRRRGKNVWLLNAVHCHGPHTKILKGYPGRGMRRTVDNSRIVAS
jgi:hypothetical protein